MEVFQQFGENNVFVGTLRGRKDQWQWAYGAGGVPTEELVKIDIVPRGGTWLWEPLGMFLKELATKIRATPDKEINARIFLLDLSGSMETQAPLIRRIWASVPQSGFAQRSSIVSGLEIMVVTDGADNESEGEWKGNDGLFQLLRQATTLGFECGTPCDDPIGKLYLTLVDIGGKTMQFTQELKGNVNLIETQDPLLLSRIIRSPRPASSGRLSVDAIEKDLLQLALDELEEIEGLAPHLGKPYDLPALFEFVLRASTGNTKALARYAMLKTLKQIVLEGLPMRISKRGSDKETYHTEINSMLYTLKGNNIVKLDDGAERWWRPGPARSLIEGQIRAMLPKPFDLQTTVNTLLQSESLEKDAQIALKRYPEETESLICALVQQAKRAKQTLDE